MAELARQLLDLQPVFAASCGSLGGAELSTVESARQWVLAAVVAAVRYKGSRAAGGGPALRALEDEAVRLAAGG